MPVGLTGYIWAQVHWRSELIGHPGRYPVGFGVRDPGSMVVLTGFFRQPEAATVRTNPITNRLANLFSFIFLIFHGRAYLAQLGCDCELIPEIRETSLTCFVGTSSRESV